MSTQVCSSAQAHAMEALALANVVRTTNARTISEIRQAPSQEACEKVIAILLEADAKGPIGSLPIRRLLVAPRGMGETKVQEVCRRSGVFTADRKLRQLSMRQRRELASRLGWTMRRIGRAS